MITRGFQGRRSQSEPKRLPPGQHLTAGYPVLSAGPTPHTPLSAWTFALEAEDGTSIASWSWDAFRALGSTDVTVDIHCVTRWSKFDTDWRGISVEGIFTAAGLAEPPSPFVMAFCDGGYTTNLPVEDLLEGKALVVWEYDGEPLEPEHGGPARLLVPHLYFWKSAKGIRGRDLTRSDARFTLWITLARDSAPGWSGAVGRIDLSAVEGHVSALDGVADSFVCGSDGFVEAASALLMCAGQPGEAIRTERFGPTGIQRV